MDKNKVSEWIDGLVLDLVDSNKTLEDSLSKTLVLAFQLKNDKLRTWANHELNGYPNTASAPSYRIVNVQLKASAIQERFGGAIQRIATIPYEISKHDSLKKLSEGFAMLMGIARLEQVKLNPQEGGHLTIPMPVMMIPAAQQLIKNYTIESLWLEIPDLTITAILSNIKNHLLQFLLELNQELGNTQGYTILNSTKKVDEILERNIGTINAENVIFNGVNNQIKENRGNAIQGGHGTINVNDQAGLVEKLGALSKELKTFVEELTALTESEKIDIEHEIQAVNNQIKKDKPNFSILNKSLQIIEGILLNTASDV